MPLLRRVIKIIAIALVAVAMGVSIALVAMTNSTPTGSESQEVSMLNRIGRSLTAADVAIRERRYAAHHRNGSGEPDSVHWIDRTDTSNLVIVAPHAVNHHRDGEVKFADRYTGAIAEILANRLGASVLTTTGEVSDWGEDWETRDDEFTDILHSLDDTSLIVDLHGMADGSSREPISIGTAKKESGPSMELAENIADAFNGAAEINETFSARSNYTVTRHMHKRGHNGVQIEIAGSLREPGELNVGYTIDALVHALETADTPNN